MHERVDDPFFTESRAGVISSRALPIRSNNLELIGICDLVEFVPSPDGVPLAGRKGLFQPIPIEYKRGIPNPNSFDEAQLCAQAICLEEMLSTTIETGFLYYAQIRRRTQVTFSTELRQCVINAAKEMQQYYRRNYTPRVKPQKHCKSCSMVEICLPKIQNQTNSVTSYITAHLEEDE